MKTWFTPDGFVGDDPISKHNARWLAVFGVVAIVIWLLAMFIVYSQASDAFVQMLERREGMSPGHTRVLPECSCTIQYLGTTVRGRDYEVHIRRLD